MPPENTTGGTLNQNPAIRSWFTAPRARNILDEIDEEEENDRTEELLDELEMLEDTEELNSAMDNARITDIRELLRSRVRSQEQRDRNERILREAMQGADVPIVIENAPRRQSNNGAGLYFGHTITMPRSSGSNRFRLPNFPSDSDSFMPPSTSRRGVNPEVAQNPHGRHLSQNERRDAYKPTKDKVDGKSVSVDHIKVT